MQEKNLNLIPSGDMPVIYASQYDKNRVIRFNLFDGEDEYTLSGTETVKCNIRKNDEHIVIITPTIGANKYIDIYLTEQACACFGSNIGEITISSDEDTLIGTINFILEVERNPIQGGVTSETDIDDLTGQIEDIVHEIMSDDYYTKSEVDAALNLKANAADVYTKSEVDTALGLKADKSTTYTKTEVDTALALKADSSSVYTKSEVDTALALKANASDVYTKTEVDEIIENLYPVNTASGSIANFTTSLEMPLVALSSTIVAQQAGTGTPSPSNPRSISGVSSVGLTHTGKNLFDPVVYSSFLQSDGKYRGAANSIVAVRTNVGGYIGKQLTFSIYADLTVSPTPTNVKVAVIINGVTTTGNPIESGTVGYSSVTFTPQSENDTVLITFGSAGGNSYTFYGIQLEAGSTRTAYEPYTTPETKTIALGQTVYGGVLDAKNGKLRITWGIVTDWSNLRVVNNQTGTNTYECIVNDIPKKTGVSNIISNEFETKAYTDDGNYGMRGYGSSSDVAFRFPISEVSTPADAKAFLINNNVVLVYELATPIEITGLTPANFTTIAGEQNIFADSGDVSVSFKQGIQEYIDSKVGG